MSIFCNQIIESKTGFRMKRLNLSVIDNTISSLFRRAISEGIREALTEMRTKRK